MRQVITHDIFLFYSLKNYRNIFNQREDIKLSLYRTRHKIKYKIVVNCLLKLKEMDFYSIELCYWPILWFRCKTMMQDRLSSCSILSIMSTNITLLNKLFFSLYYFVFLNFLDVLWVFRLFRTKANLWNPKT